MFWLARICVLCNQPTDLICSTVHTYRGYGTSMFCELNVNKTTCLHYSAISAKYTFLYNLQYVYGFE